MSAAKKKAAAPDHSARAHALLSPSGASRWLKCTPSAMLEAGEPDKTTSYSEEGTLAHEFAEVYLRGEPWMEKELEKLRKHELYAPEMEEYAQGYVNYVNEIAPEKAKIIPETKLDLTAYVPEGFGTADCIIIGDGTLTIVDYKYGKGVRVDADNNPQLELYALGALDMYSFAFDDIETVRLCIYQPRLDHISEWSLPAAALSAWGSDYAKPQAELAAKGEGEPVAGAHCQFCRYAHKCKALAEYSLAVAAKDFEDESGALSTNELKPEDWTTILGRAPVVKRWLEMVENEAINKLLADPAAIPHFKVVEGRSVRKYADAHAVTALLDAAGYGPENYYKPAELLGITDMTKMLGGAKKFDAILGSQIVKPQGKPTVVPETDKRPVFVSNAGEEFADESLL